MRKPGGRPDGCESDELMRFRLGRAGLRCNDQLYGLSHSGDMNENRLLALLADLPSGISEIYLHPATQSGAAITPTMDGYHHTAELAALMSATVADTVKTMRTAGLRCGGYSDLPEHRLP
jgi:chitin disaccharide deacetylase